MFPFFSQLIRSHSNQIAWQGAGPPPPMTTFHGASIFRSTNQVLGATGDYVTFDSVNYDTNSFFSLGDPTKLTIPTSGKYFIGFNFSLDPINVPGGEIFIEVNGGIGVCAIGDDATMTFRDCNGAATWEFIAGDFIKLFVGYDATFLNTTGNPQFWIANYT